MADSDVEILDPETGISTKFNFGNTQSPPAFSFISSARAQPAPLTRPAVDPRLLDASPSERSYQQASLPPSDLSAAEREEFLAEQRNQRLQAGLATATPSTAPAAAPPADLSPAELAEWNREQHQRQQTSTAPAPPAVPSASPASTGPTPPAPPPRPPRPADGHTVQRQAGRHGHQTLRGAHNAHETSYPMGAHHNLIAVTDPATGRVSFIEQNGQTRTPIGPQTGYPKEQGGAMMDLLRQEAYGPDTVQKITGELKEGKYPPVENAKLPTVSVKPAEPATAAAAPAKAPAATPAVFATTSPNAISRTMTPGTMVGGG